MAWLAGREWIWIVISFVLGLALTWFWLVQKVSAHVPAGAAARTTKDKGTDSD